MGLFDIFSGFLQGSVGNNLDNDPADVRNTKRNLNNLGFFNDEIENDFITRELDTGIKEFQEQNNLRIDGRLFPHGETERTIYQTMEEQEEDVSHAFEANPFEIKHPHTHPPTRMPNNSFNDGVRTEEFRPDRDDVNQIDAITMEQKGYTDYFDKEFDPFKDSIGDLDRPLINFLPGLSEDSHFEEHTDFMRAPFEGIRFHEPIGNNNDNNTEDVIRLQRRLASLGFISSETLNDPTGILNRETLEGIKNFQRTLGLRADGLVTPDGETMQGLNAISNVLNATAQPNTQRHP